MAEQWSPAFPDFAKPSEGPLNERPDDTGAEPWTAAPADSHLEGFRYFDTRKYSFLRKFGTGSELHIRFKPKGNRGTTEYVYFFADPQKGANVFAEFVDHTNPGELVHSILIANRIPYRRLA